MRFFFTDNPDVVTFSTLMFWWQILPYVIFAISMNIRGLFLGSGRTYYILVVSLVLNLAIILPFFVMMNSLILPQAFESVMLMFVLVDIVDFAITYVLVKRLLAKLFLQQSVELI